MKRIYDRNLHMVCRVALPVLLLGWLLAWPPRGNADEALDDLGGTAQSDDLGGDDLGLDDPLTPSPSVPPSNPSTLQPPPNPVALEYDKDRPSGDYINFDLWQDQPEVCRDSCIGDPRCKAFTYVKAGVQGPRARCWLKDSVPEAISSSCCVSGVNLQSGPGASTPSAPPLGPYTGTQGYPPPPVPDPTGHPLGVNCPPGTTWLGGQCVTTYPFPPSPDIPSGK